jgi:hypothetical protein
VVVMTREELADLTAKAMIEAGWERLYDVAVA